MKNHFGSAFPSDFLQNVLIETLNISHLVLCSFWEKRWYLSGEKKTEGKQNSAAIMISVDAKGTVFLLKLKLQK